MRLPRPKERLASRAPWPASAGGQISACADGLPRAARSAVAVVILALHAIALYGLLQIGVVRQAVHDTVPIFAGLIQSFPPSAEPAFVPPPPTVRRVVPPARLAPTPLPAREVREFAAPSSEAVDAPEAAPASLAPSVTAPIPLAQPRTLSVTEVGYLEPPQVTYPPVSRRLGEEGRVTLRVLVDPRGHPVQVLLTQSSGHARLDEAAASAARRARFLPHTEDGVAQTVWVLLPIVFTLEVRR